MKAGTTAKTTKGYPRVTAGPLRNQYVHRVVAAAMIGRALTKDEEVNHKDRDRRNFWFENLYILGSKDHGWVSAKQSHYMRHQEARDRAEWEAFMAAEEARQAKEIARAKNEGKPWVSPTDGSLQEAWDQRHEA